MLTHTLPVPGPNTAAARNAVAPVRTIVKGVMITWQGSIVSLKFSTMSCKNLLSYQLNVQKVPALALHEVFHLTKN